MNPSGKCNRGRLHRDLAAVGTQCDGALQLMHAFIASTARTVNAARRTAGGSTP